MAVAASRPVAMVAGSSWFSNGDLEQQAVAVVDERHRDQDEVAGDVRRKQREQGNEAQRVDEARDVAQHRHGGTSAEGVLLLHANILGRGGYYGICI